MEIYIRNLVFRVCFMLTIPAFGVPISNWNFDWEEEILRFQESGAEVQEKIFRSMQVKARSYDRANIRTSSEQEAYKEQKILGKKGLRKWVRRTHSLSDHPVFKKIIHKGSLNIEGPFFEVPDREKNEACFSYYFSLFVLEPSRLYSHYPRLYGFFSEYFEFDPVKKEKGCSSIVMTRVPLFDSKVHRDVNFSPETVQSIEFLLIGAGEGLESRFGHVALRFCMDSEEDSPDLVVTYTADLLQESRINPIKGLGLLGSYPSMAELSRFQDVRDYYSYIENRGIESYPLELNEEQKKNLVWQVLSDIWIFRGKYSFLKRNCCTEVRDVVKSAVGMHPFFNSYPIRPVGVKNALLKTGLCLLEKRQKYESARASLRQSLSYVIKSRVKEVSKQIEDLSAAERILWYRNVIKGPFSPIEQIAWENVEVEVARIRLFMKRLRFSMAHRERFQQFLLEREIILEEGDGIPRSYEVRLPSEKDMPDDTEIKDFMNEEAAVKEFIQTLYCGCL